MEEREIIQYIEQLVDKIKEVKVGSVERDQKLSSTIKDITDKLSTYISKSEIDKIISQFEMKIPQDGKDGRDGKDGTDGKNGTDGKDGKNGLNGKNGTDGKDGLDGVNGKDGVDGKDGIDGMTPIFSSNEDYITYKLGDKTYNLIALDKIRGARGARGLDGDNGKQGKDGNDTLWVGTTNELKGIGLWIETGLGVSGTDMTFWVEEGV